MDERHNHPRTRCTATCADGSLCDSRATVGPGLSAAPSSRCAPHGGDQARVGAPRGNQNARSHGLYARTEHARPEPPDEGRTIDTLVVDGSAKQAKLSRTQPLSLCRSAACRRSYEPSGALPSSGLLRIECLPAPAPSATPYPARRLRSAPCDRPSLQAPGPTAGCHRPGSRPTREGILVPKKKG
jgi:hypothetical protein